MKHFFSNIFKGVKHRFFVKCKSISINTVKGDLQIIIKICCEKEYTKTLLGEGFFHFSIVL